MVKDYRIPVSVREDRFGGLYATVKAGILNESAHSTYLNAGMEADSLLSMLSRGQAYRFRTSGIMTLRLHDEFVMCLFGIDY